MKIIGSNYHHHPQHCHFHCQKCYFQIQWISTLCCLLFRMKNLVWILMGRILTSREYVWDFWSILLLLSEMVENLTAYQNGQSFAPFWTKIEDLKVGIYMPNFVTFLHQTLWFKIYSAQFFRGRLSSQLFVCQNWNVLVQKLSSLELSNFWQFWLNFNSFRELSFAPKHLKFGKTIAA